MYYELPLSVQSKYAHIFDEKDGMHRVATANSQYMLHGFPTYIISGLYDRFGFIDIKGNEVIAPQYMHAHDFSEDMALVETTNQQLFFINKAGHQQINLSQYDAAYPFSIGLACVQSNGKSGFIDKAGRVAIPLQFDHIFGRFDGQFNKGGNVVVIVNEKFGIIDTNGAYIFPPQFELARYTYDQTDPVFVTLYKNKEQIYLDKYAQPINKD